MAIVSVTSVAGGPKTGKTYLTSMFDSKSYVYTIKETSPKTKKELFEEMDKWKLDTINRHVVLEGDIIYRLIDYDWGNVDQYYISLQKKPCIVFKEEPETKPLFE